MMELVPMPDGAGYGFLHRANPRCPPRATVVMLNAGLIHRVGPFRMNIELAERLARRGIDLFRFDAVGKITEMRAFFGPANMGKA